MNYRDISTQAEAVIRKQEDATSPAASGSEAANARNARDMLLNALRDLESGDYSGFLCCVDLAGQFARDARSDYYARARK